jgi:NAD(P)-dependent dehydrogenase (short-subunit alcohol dehydrogenase family)
MDYRDKVVIITGGTKGIGKGCVRAFADAGSIVIFCARDNAEGNALASEFNAARKGEVFFVRCDVSKTEDIRNLIEAAVSKYGRIDCLVNNAGWHPPHKPIDDFSIEEFQDLLNLNLVSIFTACKFALPHLRRTKGNIINMSSLVGQRFTACASIRYRREISSRRYGRKQ